MTKTGSRWQVSLVAPVPKSCRHGPWLVIRGPTMVRSAPPVYFRGAGPTPIPFLGRGRGSPLQP